MLFDDMPTAMLTLFEISTTEGWTDVMFEAIDAAGGKLKEADCRVFPST